MRGSELRRAAPPSSGDPERLHLVQPVLVAVSRGAAIVGVLIAAVVVAAFGWEPADVAAGGAIGMVLWGAVWFLAIRDLIPRGTLLAPPDRAVVGQDEIARRPWWRSPAQLAWVVPVCAAGGWLADRWDLGPVFAPGQPLGMAAAYLLGAGLVGRWQRAHGRLALFREHDGDAELYAAGPGLTAGR